MLEIANEKSPFECQAKKPKRLPLAFYTAARKVPARQINVARMVNLRAGADTAEFAGLDADRPTEGNPRRRLGFARTAQFFRL